MYYYIRGKHYDGTPKWYISPKVRYNVIYQISIGEAVYVGSSTNLQKRICQHEKQLRDNTHSSSMLQSEFNKHHSYNLKILEILDKNANYKMLLEREQFYIDSIHPNANSNNAMRKRTKHILVNMDLDLIPFIESQTNKNSFINDCIRKQMQGH